MKSSKNIFSRLLAFSLAAALLLSDQTILYAAEAGALLNAAADGESSGNMTNSEGTDVDSETASGEETTSGGSTTTEEGFPSGNDNPSGSESDSGAESSSGNPASTEGQTPANDAEATGDGTTIPGGTSSDSETVSDGQSSTGEESSSNSQTENGTELPAGDEIPAESPVSPEATNPIENPETSAGEVTASMTLSESWNPKRMDESFSEEAFAFEQEWIGQDIDSEYTYHDSYGSQLTDELARKFYQALSNCMETLLSEETQADEEDAASALSLGTVATPAEVLEGDDYQTFRTIYETAAQNAFDAFWLDEADAALLNTPACALTVTYTGTQQEDQTWSWNAEAVWTLELLEPAEAEQNEESDTAETPENADDLLSAEASAETNPPAESDATASQDSTYLTVSDLYDQAASYMEETLASQDLPADESTSMEEEADNTAAETEPAADTGTNENTADEKSPVLPEGEIYARYFKKLCDEADIESVLVTGIVGERISTWNLVHMPDDQWYAVDIFRGVFLSDAGDTADETSFSNTHTPYGDISNSHLGQFVYPALSTQPYAFPAITTLEAAVLEPAMEDEPETPAEPEPEESAAGPAPAMPAAEPVTIDLSQCQYEYQDLWTTQDDLNQVRPTSLTYQGKELTLGTDYTISYQGTARSAVTGLGTAGNYTMLLTGTGNYSGTLALSFRVASGTSVNTLTASAIKAQKYTGKALTPKLTLKDPVTRKTLKSGTHYTLSYENNVNAGTASIVIQGIEANGYVGTRRVTFTIQPCEIKKASAKILDKKIYYTGTAQTPRVSLTYKKMGLVEGRDYQISYSSNTNKGKGIITLTGIGNYSSTRTLKFTISARKMKEANIVMSAAQDTYNGPTLYPSITVSFNGITLREGTDYTVSYPKKLKAGKNTIKVKGKTNFSGTVSLKFTVNKAPMESAVVTLPYAWAYTGKNVKVIPTQVMIEDTVLTYKKDYTVKYIDSNGKKSSSVKKLGEYQILLTGKGNYIGTLTLKFCITDDQTLLNNNYNSGAGTITGGNTFTLNSCRASSYDGRQITVTLDAGRNSALENLGSQFYVARLNSAGTAVLEAMAGNTSVSGSFTISAAFPSSDGFQSAMMSKYAIAIRNGSGYQIVSTARYLENPEITATMTKEYLGYYTSDKISSKKGMQGTTAYTEDMAVQHVLLNVDLADMVSTTPRSGYVPYTYKGTTYYFQDMIALVQTMRHLNGWDNDNPYGWHNRSITLVLLMSWDDELSYLIHPAARKKGAASYYALNMQDENARNTFEALFCYMGEKLGTEKSRVSNWTLGNEVNSCKEWNYSGSMSLSECVANYAQAFQLLYQGVRRTSSTSRVFISLDHCWTASVAGHSGKEFLDQFASYMNQTAPSMEWNVNYHPYSQPLTRTAFWSDNSNTTGSVSTKYISMKNIQVLTDYLGSLESQYGKAGGSIRVIIGELGYTAVQGNTSAETAQAAALGYGYYIAMFNSRIDAYIVRAYLDDPAETVSGLYLGVMSKNDVKKQSYDVYKYLDTERSLEYMNKYLSTIGISSWESVIGGFNAEALPAVDF